MLWCWVWCWVGWVVGSGGWVGWLSRVVEWLGSFHFFFLKKKVFVFNSPNPTHQRFTMLTAFSRRLAILFSVVRFLLSPQAQFVLSTLLVVHGTNWLLAMREPLGVVGQPWVSLQHRQHSTCRWTRLVLDRENILWCGAKSSLVHAFEVKTYTGMYFGLRW